MSSTRKRGHPPGLNKLQSQTVRKKSRSSPCNYSSPSTSQCHSSSVHSSSPMQLRKRKTFGKERAVGSACASFRSSPQIVVVDQQVPGELGPGDFVGSTGEEMGLFEEDPEMAAMYAEQDSSVVPEASAPSDPKGELAIFPNEVFYMILSYLSNSDLSRLSLTSTEMNTAVREFSCTRQGCRQILLSLPPMVMGVGHLLSASQSLDESKFTFPCDPNEDSIVDIVKKFEGLGFLMRKLTIVLPAKSRLKLASFFFNKLSCTYQALVVLLGHCAAYFCCGRLLFTFIRGWGNVDKIKAYNMVHTLAKLEQRVKKVVFSSPSALNRDERDVRWLHRHVFLDHAIVEGEESYAFWISHILKPWPITCQARLLYLLTAPHDSQGYISWTLACGCSNLQHLSGSVDFSELANSLRVLLEHCPRDWSMADIISIIDELTTTPNGWCLENVAQLLVHCGADITKGVLTSRATNGRINELALLCFYLGNTCCTLETKGTKDINISWFLDVVRTTVRVLPPTTNKAEFLSSIVNTWQDYLSAIFRDSTPDDAENDQIQVDFFNTLGNLTMVTSRLLQTVLNVAD